MGSYQKSETPDVTVRRPEIIEIISQILTHHSRKGRRKPKMFPSDPKEAAKFWLNHQRPADDYTEAMTPHYNNYELMGFSAPYHDRVVKTLRVFLGLKEIHQVFIIDCVGKGMEWRGEDMAIYPDIAKQYEEMWKDVDAYKAKAGECLRVLQ